MKTQTTSALIVTLALLCLLLPNTQAVSPQPDGGYPGGNTAEGDGALLSLTSGVWNTALGRQALNDNTTGVGNTATGFQALFHNTTGNQNTAYGAQALFSNGSNRPGSSNNTATGYGALYRNADGGNNTANGAFALFSNTEGLGNTAIGTSALSHNVLGNANTAVGYQALFSNTFEAGANTATGYQALHGNTTGSSNTSTGYQALFSNTEGGGNTAYGELALHDNTTAVGNVAIGYRALYHATGNGNIALGTYGGENLTTGDSNIDIGNSGVAGESYTIRVGEQGFHTATYIAGISGSTVPGGVSVIIDGNGHLGTINSSAHYKEAIRPMDKASEAILALQPVTFRYKHELDPDNTRQFGLVAEQVEKIDPDLVARDDHGKPYTVRYEAVNAMLLNEFLKAHRKMEEQQKQIDLLTAQLEKQATVIQRVSDQLEIKTATSLAAK